MTTYTLTKSNGDVILANTMPQSEYMYGCTPTSVGMILGYYDLYGYHGTKMPNLISGTVELNSRGTDGNAYDMDAFDTVLGRAIASEGHVNRFYKRTHEEEWRYTYKGNTSELNTAEWDCIADYLGTGQFWRGNTDLFTWTTNCTLEELYTNREQRVSMPDGRRILRRNISMLYGLDLYVRSRGYSLDRKNTGTYVVDVNGGSFTFERYMKEIDAGRPVLISITRHSMVGYGYNPKTREIIFDDCYFADRRMTWDGTYYYSDKKRKLESITTIVFNVSSGDAPARDTVKPKSSIPQLALVCEETGKEIHVISGFSVGRHELKRLKDEYQSFYSHEQFKVLYLAGHWMLIPCPGVTNKTFVNRSVVHNPVVLHDGNVICVGNEVTKKTVGEVRVKFLS